MGELTVGILGQGFIGTIHREEAQAAGLNVVAIADTDPKKLEGINGSIRTYEGYESLVSQENDLDAVIIALPDKLHLPAMQAVADSNIGAVLLEKPLAQNLEDAISIDALVGSETRTMIGLTGHYHPEFQAAYQNLPRIGALEKLSERIHLGVQGFPVETYLPSNGRGIVLENGVHTFDRFLLFSGSDADLDSIKLNYLNDDNFGRNSDDNAAGSLQMDSGLPAEFSFKWFNQDHEDYVFTAQGENGTITVRGFIDSRLKLSDSQEEVLYQHDTSLSLTDRHRPGIQEELQAFRDFTQGSEGSHLLDYALGAQKVVEKIYNK